jgi:subtilisin family serine protease
MYNSLKYFKPKIFIVPLLFIFFSKVSAQENYWVFFKDKSGCVLNPYQYFDKKAIERRIKNNISLYDSTDFPVNDHYIKKLESISSPVRTKSRWFNAVAVSLSEDQLNQVSQLSFVKSYQKSTKRKAQLAGDYDTVLTSEDKRLLEFQVKRLQGELFYSNGFTGKGMRIAVFDAGFPLVNELQVFEHLFKNQKIKASWDFARKKQDVFVGNPHGTMVLSCITGILNNRKMGMATESEFLLARTEVDRESYVEEEYWLQAVEWADKNGADIINSSLAYTFERYYTYEMDGHISLVARAANLAASKGILVINAMGNDGNADWKILATPADADSVLSVGAISPITDFHAGFSSFGPTAGYKLKPNIVAPGKVIAAGKLKLERAEGTSFAAPIVTGFAACAWQSMPYLTNMQLFEKIEQSGHLYPYFDYAHGYGIPQASFFIHQGKIQTTEPTFNFVLQNDTVYIEVDEKYIDKKNLKNTNYLYYHIENNNGYLESYWLIDVFSKKAAVIKLNEWPDGKILRAHFRGFTNEIGL